MASLAELSLKALADDGPLQRALPGYRTRHAQLALGVDVAHCIDDAAELVAEAGTGTGKTYAYLVPALLSGLRVIISTGTRALQDQLYHRDLPQVRRALGVGTRSALLKGRANYLCLYRLDQARGTVRAPAQASQLQQVVAWSSQTRSGDLAENEALPEDSPLRGLVTSTVDNCLGGECPLWSECFVVRARQAAQAADIVVVNHHLLLADLALREEGFGEVLPGAQAFILDEAHQLPDLAAQFFGARLGSRQLVELGRDVLSEAGQVAGAVAALQEPVQRLEPSIQRTRLALDRLPPRAAAARALALPAAVAAFDDLADVLDTLLGTLDGWRDASPGMAACRERASVFAERLAEWRGAAVTDEVVELDEPYGSRVATDETIAAVDHEAAGSQLAGTGPEVRWVETAGRGFVLQRTPLDVSGPLRRYRERSGAAWVFTSATLAVAGRFTHIASRLGLEDPRTSLQPSPFDWDHQALCYLPQGLPDPNAGDYGVRVSEVIRPVLEASGGRAFMLFTSHRALQEAAARMAGGPWPLFVQGTAPRHALLQAFRESGNGVLLGAASFWEGVDVAGDALSVVVIDRLPFASPDDPVLEARLDAVKLRGGNPFRDEQLPGAVIALKQGVGRLIRTLEDRGVLVLCDPRLTGKGYGRMFLASLPPMPRTQSLADVQAFFDPVSFGDDHEWGEPS